MDDNYLPPQIAPVPVRVLYRNHAGIQAWRTIVPVAFRYGISDHHKDAQWLVYAWDVEKMAERTFALKDVIKWELPGG